MSKVINSKDYWDERFSGNWEINSGPAQSRFFADVAIDNLPSWLIRSIRKENLKVADWGCAQGDGTNALAKVFDPKQLVGVDFSRESISTARERYGAINFLEENWLENSLSSVDEQYDFVFSSNTLEHFHDPFDILQKILCRAKFGLILALPYREYERIDEHFFTFTKDNIPTRLGGFSLFWSKVVDCSLFPNTMWNGDQIILFYGDPEWSFNRLEFLSDIYIDSGSGNDKLAGYDSLSWHREFEFSKTLRFSFEELSEKLKDIKTVLSQQKLDNKFLIEQIAELKLSVRQKENFIDMLKKSTSWKITAPIRMFGDIEKKIKLKNIIHFFLKGIYKVLPNFAKNRLHSLKAKYLNKRYSEFANEQGEVSLVDAPEWLLMANSCETLAIIPCGFEFDELVNQRPINFSKCFSSQGINTLFISWQWSPDEKQERSDSEVYPNVWQVSLYDFLKYLPLLSGGRKDSIYLATLPAEILVEPIYFLRGKGFKVIYDIMDNWEEFFKAGQAPWYKAEAEEFSSLEC